MKLYIVRACGVYLKDINYISIDKDIAINVCKSLARGDADDYHLWAVCEIESASLSLRKDTDTIHEPIFETDKRAEENK